MPRYSVAEARNTLPRLIDRALAGEEVVITRHGKEVIELKPRQAFDREAYRASLAELAAWTDARPGISINSADLIRQMRDEGR